MPPLRSLVIAASSPSAPGSAAANPGAAMAPAKTVMKMALRMVLDGKGVEEVPFSECETRVVSVNLDRAKHFGIAVPAEMLDQKVEEKDFHRGIFTRTVKAFKPTSRPQGRPD